MTLGAGILLSSLSIGTILLFLKTQGKWNWKKIIKISLLSVISMVLILSLFIFTTNYIDTQPKKVEKFWGIAATATKSDIIFLKGKPTTIIADFKSEEDSSWDYYNAYQIKFKNDKIWAIIYSGDDLSEDSLNNIGLLNTTEDITKKLGRKYNVTLSKDLTTRLYRFSQYNCFFILEKNCVRAYGYFNPKYGIPIFKNQNEKVVKVNY